MPGYPQSPAPGSWLVDVPYGWEEDADDAEYVALMAETDPDFCEDPILRALRLEAEAEQDAEWDKTQKSPKQHARIMKETFNARKTLNLDGDLSNMSVGSFETEDFMSQPSESFLDLNGELAYLEAYKEKAKKHKKLRKLLNQSLASPVKKPPAQAIKGPSPRKFLLPNLDSDSEDEVIPLPTLSRLKLAKAGKKTFFAPVSVKSPSPVKLKSPSPYKYKSKAPVRKSFFSMPTPKLSDSDSDDIPIPVFKPKFKVKKNFFSAPVSSSPAKLSPFKKAGHAAVAISKAEYIKITALNSQLHDRIRFLQKVQSGNMLYQPTALLPSNVNVFLQSRKCASGYLELAVDIEQLIINAMIMKIEAGITKVNPEVLLHDAKQKLKEKYNLLAGNLAAI